MSTISSNFLDNALYRKMHYPWPKRLWLNHYHYDRELQLHKNWCLSAGCHVTWVRFPSSGESCYWWHRYVDPGIFHISPVYLRWRQQFYFLNHITILCAIVYIHRHLRGNGTYPLCDVLVGLLPFEINNKNYLLLIGVILTRLHNFFRSSDGWRVG